MIVWCDTCKDYTLDNVRHECSWCESKFTTKNLEKAKTDERVGKNRKQSAKRA